MARNRIAYILLLLLATAFVYLCPGEVSSALLYTLLALPPLSFLLSLGIFFFFRFSQSLPDSVIRGETAALTISMRNRFPLLCSLELQFYGADTYLSEALLPIKTALLPLGQAKVTLPLRCKHLGWVQAGIRQIIIWDYLGLFSLRRTLQKPMKLAVMPRIHPIRFPITAQNAGGTHLHSGKEQEERILSTDIRSYVYGDRLKQVHWKLSAKKNDLLVRNMESETGPSVKLVLSLVRTDATGEEAATQRDVFLETALSLVNWFAEHKIGLSVLYPADRVRQFTIVSREEVFAATDMLMDLQPSSESSIQALFHWEGVSFRRGDTVILLCTNLDDQLAGQAAALTALSANVMAVIAGNCPEPRPDQVPAFCHMRIVRISSPEDIGTALGGNAR